MKTINASMLALAAAAALAVTACSKTEPKTVAYYTANKAERDQVIAACKNDPGGHKDDPDCANASASVIQGWGKTRMPSVDYAPKASAAASS